MKKFLWIAISLLFVFSACEGPAGTPGWDGEDLNWNIRFFTVKQSDWRLVDDGEGWNPYFICVMNYPEIDEFVYDSGLVSGFLLLSDGEGNEVQTPLPYVVHRENAYGDMWTETYTYDYMAGSGSEPGTVAFYARYSDFAIDVKPPRCDFRIVLNW